MAAAAAAGTERRRYTRYSLATRCPHGRHNRRPAAAAAELFQILLLKVRNYRTGDTRRVLVDNWRWCDRFCERVVVVVVAVVV